MNQNFRELIDRYLTDSLTASEQRTLYRLSRTEENQETLKLMIDQALASGRFTDTEDLRLRELIYLQIEPKLNEPAAELVVAPVIPLHKSALPIRLRRLVIAAVVILGVGAYLFFFRKTTGTPDKPQGIPAAIVKNDALPAGAKATLTLSNGSVITLDSARNGALTLQGSAKLVKQNGLLAYHAAEHTAEAGSLYNTLSTPRGGQYRLVLSDGTKVWLDAASSIRYPATFAGKERAVVITGEAYFDVFPNPAMPFKVKVNDAEIVVLGTEFNIMAYEEESAMKATLLKGAVKITGAGGSRLLKPGEQAQLNKNGEIKLIPDADVEEAVAWKNGFFHFSNASLAFVMRQLTRWYDLDVLYEDSLPSRQFEGDIQRDLNLSQVLKILERNKIHFRIENKKVIVMP